MTASVDTVAGAAPTDAEVPPSRPDEPNRPEALRDDRA
jgi:hypothetical protein